ncbi:hypothetical protein CHS0354_008927 [Potamilus streckersoni]|uniref:Uncharacterized protein n=1 Tax=Potamilus streckersoni TaxID=2493646 RepID=A0AAE0VHN5_9BIVA|nr:hypothetical protein CHS0354_008927 [Potamilus streckersoni]
MQTNAASLPENLNEEEASEMQTVVSQLIDQVATLHLRGKKVEQTQNNTKETNGRENEMNEDIDVSSDNITEKSNEQKSETDENNGKPSDYDNDMTTDIEKTRGSMTETWRQMKRKTRQMRIQKRREVFFKKNWIRQPGEKIKQNWRK